MHAQDTHVLANNYGKKRIEKKKEKKFTSRAYIGFLSVHVAICRLLDFALHEQ